mmetsp:Transcript_85831/g.240001  ORF Transcript_85831/g.240001 Transcript_85831/m.240001 type:complete len:262 (+) Transcript_85831:232-1017(+)
MNTLSGYASLKLNTQAQMCRACCPPRRSESPRSQMSPLKRYAVCGAGEPWAFHTCSKSLRCPCVSPMMTSRPEGGVCSRKTVGSRKKTFRASCARPSNVALSKGSCHLCLQWWSTDSASAGVTLPSCSWANMGPFAESACISGPQLTLRTNAPFGSEVLPTSWGWWQLKYKYCCDVASHVFRNSGWLQASSAKSSVSATRCRRERRSVSLSLMASRACKSFCCACGDCSAAGCAARKWLLLAGSYQPRPMSHWKWRCPVRG